MVESATGWALAIVAMGGALALLTKATLGLFRFTLRAREAFQLIERELAADDEPPLDGEADAPTVKRGVAQIVEQLPSHDQWTAFRADLLGAVEAVANAQTVELAEFRDEMHGDLQELREDICPRVERLERWKETMEATG